MEEQRPEQNDEVYEIEDETDFDPENPAPEPASDDAPAGGAPGVSEQLDELHNRLLRVSADYENYKRRTAGNIQSSLEQQLMGIARDLVPVLDHFDRAVEIDPDKSTVKDLLNGVTIVRDELIRVLGRYGIERVEAAVGDPVDPNRHEAMMRQPVDGVDSNHVAMQLQPGYMLKEKTIRPAGVSVAE